MKLFCFPFAGGGAFSYAPLKRALQPPIELVAHELPGHGARMREPLRHTVDELVDDFFATTGREIAGRFAFFGHSLGALVAWEAARRLARENRPLPMHLFLSGREGPFLPNRFHGCWTLPSAEFRELLARLGGSPPEVLSNAELLSLFEPILRCDFEVVGRYAPQRSEPLAVPFTIFYGEDEFSADDARQWSELTAGTARYVCFPGGHFALLARWPDVARIVSSSVLSHLHG